MPKRARELRPPLEVVQSIKEKAELVRSAATQLSSRIEQFQEYLGSLPGRVETWVYGPHPLFEHSDRELGLQFSRQGNKWIICYGTYTPENDPENPVDWKPLTEAAVKIKLAAIKLFPELLDSIEDQQEKMAKELRDATAEFDQFASKLNLPAPLDGPKRTKLVPPPKNQANREVEE